MSSVSTGTLAAAPARLADFFELTKPRITFLVLVTTAVGYAVGLSGSFDPAAFAALLAGTALVSGGASALNQYWEREADSRMHRTRSRPIPSGRLMPGDALAFGLVISTAGFALLATVNGATYFLGVAALASYVLAYTPLKRVTPLCTVVGAVPGAIPPMMGWAAARGTLDPGAWGLFSLLFLWQLPHFLAIGWMFREDYERGGFPMLMVVDRDGSSTARQAVLACAALLPVTVLAGALVSGGLAYLLGALALGGVFLASSLRFAVRRTAETARGLFLVSILYLPAVLALMVFGR